MFEQKRRHSVFNFVIQSKRQGGKDQSGIRISSHTCWKIFRAEIQRLWFELKDAIAMPVEAARHEQLNRAGQPCQATNVDLDNSRIPV